MSSLKFLWRWPPLEINEDDKAGIPQMLMNVKNIKNRVNAEKLN